MSDSGHPLTQCVPDILERYCRQNGLAPLGGAETGRIAARLWLVIAVRGLPRRLAPDEMGAPGEMSDAEVGPLVDCVLEGSGRAGELAKAVRQLVKACLSAEFRTCRESYRERESDGSCRRQQLGRARGRVSGSHCVDCPYWTSLTPEQHEACLAKGWAGDVAAFAAGREVFLPEDFRVLRRVVQAEAVRESAGG